MTVGRSELAPIEATPDTRRFITRAGRGCRPFAGGLHEGGPHPKTGSGGGLPARPSPHASGEFDLPAGSCGLVDHGRGWSGVSQTSLKVRDGSPGACEPHGAGVAQVVELEVFASCCGAGVVPRGLEAGRPQVATAVSGEQERVG